MRPVFFAVLVGLTVVSAGVFAKSPRINLDGWYAFRWPKETRICDCKKLSKKEAQQAIMHHRCERTKTSSGKQAVSCAGSGGSSLVAMQKQNECNDECLNQEMNAE